MKEEPENQEGSFSPFETLHSEEMQAGRFTIVLDRVRVNGKEQNYDYLRIREGVSILAKVGNQIILQRQYRYPVREWQWELPGGFVDEGETPEVAAARELKEETGYLAKNIKNLGFFYPSFGSTNEKIHLFLIECEEKGETALEPGEVIRQHLVSVEELERMILDGEFRHGAGLAAWARAGLYPQSR